LKLTLPLGKYSTVFEAEIYANLACVSSLYNERKASIAICSDSQAALKALQSAKTRSSLVAETKSALSKLSTFSSVLWVPGHNNVPGNEIADKLAKQAAALEFVGTVFGISSNTAQNTMSSWASLAHRNLWQSTTGCRQAKCSFKAMINDLHNLRRALVRNICVSLLAYLLDMLL